MVDVGVGVGVVVDVGVGVDVEVEVVVGVDFVVEVGVGVEVEVVVEVGVDFVVEVVVGVEVEAVVEVEVVNHDPTRRRLLADPRMQALMRVTERRFGHQAALKQLYAEVIAEDCYGWRWADEPIMVAQKDTSRELPENLSAWPWNRRYEVARLERNGMPRGKAMRRVRKEARR